MGNRLISKVCIACKQDLSVEKFHKKRPRIVKGVAYYPTTSRCKKCYPNFKLGKERKDIVPSKVCVACKRDLPLDNFHQYNSEAIRKNGKICYSRCQKCKDCKPYVGRKAQDPDAKSKKCSKCDIVLPMESFPLVIRRGQTIRWRECTRCKRVSLIERQAKRRSDPGYKEYARKAANIFYNRHADQINEKSRQYRTRPEHKEYRKKYWRKSNGQKEKHYNRTQKYVKELADHYVKGRMIQNGFKKEGITAEMIEIYRLNIIFLREMEEQRKKQIA